MALVRVEGLQIVERRTCLLRPPRRSFPFSYLHGITWERVRHEPTFAEAWPGLSRLLDGATFLAAHNAPFDRQVLTVCCQSAGLSTPRLPFECTMLLARRRWGIRPTRLPDVCARLGLPLKHHDPASDAEACARILIASADSRATAHRIQAGH